MKHEMILSASGWRKVFAASGNEQDKSSEITVESRAIAVASACVFFDYLKNVSGQECPVIAVGMDTRPTGAALADAMLRTLVKKGAVIQYLGVSSAPEIMAYARKLDGFIYIFSSSFFSACSSLFCIFSSFIVFIVFLLFSLLIVSSFFDRINLLSLIVLLFSFF